MQPALGGTQDALLFVQGDRIDCKAKTGWAAVTDLYKHDSFPIPHDQIQFANTEADIARKKRKALPGQMVEGGILGSTPKVLGEGLPFWGRIHRW